MSNRRLVISKISSTTFIAGSAMNCSASHFGGSAGIVLRISCSDWMFGRWLLILWPPRQS
jgi:hypothetical protein